MADVIPLHPAKPVHKVADIDPRYQGVGDRLVRLGFGLESLMISRDFGCVEIAFEAQAQATLFVCCCLVGEPDSRILESKYDSGNCRVCGKAVKYKDKIYWVPSKGPQAIRKYRRKAVNPAAKSRELWTDKAYVCHAACTPMAAGWAMVDKRAVRVRAQDLTWVEYRLSQMPEDRIGSDDDESYPITSDPGGPRPPIPSPCALCGDPIVGRRRDAKYCCRAHQVIDLRFRNSKARRDAQLAEPRAVVEMLSELENSLG